MRLERAHRLRPRSDLARHRVALRWAVIVVTVERLGMRYGLGVVLKYETGWLVAADLLQTSDAFY